MKTKLETYITSAGARNGAYISFPTTRKAIAEQFQKCGISWENWYVAGVKTGSNAFGRAVLNCRDPDELNYLGYWISQLTEDEYTAFFEMAEAGCAFGDRVADYINLAANIYSHFYIDNVCNERELGQYCVCDFLNEHKDTYPPEMLFDLYGQFESIGADYAMKNHGRFYNGGFYGRTDSWKSVYEEDSDDIPAHLRLNTPCLAKRSESN